MSKTKKNKVKKQETKKYEWDIDMAKILFIAFGLPILISIMISTFVFEFHDSYANWNRVDAHIKESAYLFNVPKSPKVYKYSYSVDGAEVEGVVTSWNNLEGNIKVYVNPEDSSVSKYSSELNNDLVWTLIMGFVMGGIVIFIAISILFDN